MFTRTHSYSHNRSGVLRLNTSPTPLQVTADKCTFSSKIGACVVVDTTESSLVLRGSVVSHGFGAGAVVLAGARMHGINATLSENLVSG